MAAHRPGSGEAAEAAAGSAAEAAAREVAPETCPNPSGLPYPDFASVPTPCYVVDEDRLEWNLRILRSVQDRAGCRILLALKGFSMFSVFPLVGRYLAGIAASSPFEARLGREEMGKEVHVYSPAFSDADFDALLGLCDHIVFNSISQWQRFGPRVAAANRESGRARPIECGLRVNPERSVVGTPIYDPCAPGSRLGLVRQGLDTALAIDPGVLDGLDGLHVHALCEQGVEPLEQVVEAVKARFGDLLPRMKWLNLGGGHHITRPDYDVDRLVRLLSGLRDRYGVQLYLEPGEAIALQTGFLVASVLDLVDGDPPVAILDTSAACHMPDVLEMPYRPAILGAGLPGEGPWTCRLGGPTCLAGDVAGDYSFPAPLVPGDRLVFCDMAHYTMVKNNTFNGVNLPSIALASRAEGVRVLRRFGYDDYRTRLS